MHSASAHVMATPAAIDGASGRKRRVLIFVTEPRNPTEITGLAAGSGLECLTAAFGDAGMGHVGGLAGGSPGTVLRARVVSADGRSRLPEDAMTSAQGSGQRGHRSESSRERELRTLDADAVRAICGHHDCALREGPLNQLVPRDFWQSHAALRSELGNSRQALRKRRDSKECASLTHTAAHPERIDPTVRCQRQCEHVPVRRLRRGNGAPNPIEFGLFDMAFLRLSHG